MGESLLHGLHLVGLPNIYINIYIYKSKDGPWALHLSERLQTFRKVAFWFINSTQVSDIKNFCFLVLPGILKQTRTSILERGKKL